MVCVCPSRPAQKETVLWCPTPLFRKRINFPALKEIWWFWTFPDFFLQWCVLCTVPEIYLVLTSKLWKFGCSNHECFCKAGLHNEYKRHFRNSGEISGFETSTPLCLYLRTIYQRKKRFTEHFSLIILLFDPTSLRESSPTNITGFF